MGLWNKLSEISVKARKFCFSMNAASKLEKIEHGNSLEVKRVKGLPEIDGKNRLEVLADGYIELNEAKNIYIDNFGSKKILPGNYADEAAVERLPEIRKKLDAALSWKEHRNRGNYVKILIDLTNGFENGRIEFGDNYKTQVNRREVFETFSYYIGKLKAIDNGLYAGIISNAEKVMKKYALMEKAA